MDDCKALAEQIPIIMLYYSGYSQLHLAIMSREESYMPLQLDLTCLSHV